MASTTAVEETALQPFRRGADAHAADHSRHIPRAQGGVGDFNGGQGRGVFFTFGELEVDRPKPTLRSHRRLTGETAMIHGIRDS